MIRFAICADATTAVNRAVAALGLWRNGRGVANRPGFERRGARSLCAPRTRSRSRSRGLLRHLRTALAGLRQSDRHCLLLARDLLPGARAQRAALLLMHRLFDLLARGTSVLPFRC